MKKKLLPKRFVAETAGWYGAIAVLAAYALVSFNLISGDGFTFQLLNLTGAIGLIVIAAYKKVAQSILLNVVWGVIAVVAIVNILL